MTTIIRSISKLTVLILISLFSLATYATDFDEQGLTCNGKKQIIESQIGLAKKNNNIHRIQGLEKALYAVNTHCTNDELEAKYKKEITEKTAKVTERQQELADAQGKGNQQKIAKQKTKLSEAEKELSEAKIKLTAFYQELSAK